MSSCPDLGTNLHALRLAYLRRAIPMIDGPNVAQVLTSVNLSPTMQHRCGIWLVYGGGVRSDEHERSLNRRVRDAFRPRGDQ